MMFQHLKAFRLRATLCCLISSLPVGCNYSHSVGVRGKVCLDFEVIETALTSYREHYGRLPMLPTVSRGADQVDNEALMAVLAGTESCLNPDGVIFLESMHLDRTKRVFLDPWGVPYNMAWEDQEARPRFHGQGRKATARIWSSGPNQIDQGGGGDDVANW